MELADLTLAIVAIDGWNRIAVGFGAVPGANERGRVGVRKVRDMLDAIVHTLHVILAGAWLGGVVFTTTVVSPALKSMGGWDEAVQARVRSVIGRPYVKVGTANLALLLAFALLEGGLSGFGPPLYTEYALLAVLGDGVLVGR